MKAITKKLFFLLGLLCLPSLAHAHSAPTAGSGLLDGFNHPLHGWDHLLAMLAVGCWAAFQHGRARWIIPLAFVGVMSLGGLLGATGATLPGVEFAVSLSVVVFTALVVSKVRFRLSLSVLLVGFFGFFHGFAHGQEMPSSASLLSFGIGFVAATLLLHGLGMVVACIIAVSFASLACAIPALGQCVSDEKPVAAAPPAEEPKKVTRMKPIVVTGRVDDLVGFAESAAVGTVGAAQLRERPTLRPGELLETVPGVIITQHSGAGKANQYFLRGFNLDHGTDFATSLDGMPVNMPTHGHGQGYTDLNLLIPELVTTIDYRKGPYYAEQGDFASAGAANISYATALPQTLVQVEGGSFNHGRGVFLASPRLGNGHLLYGGEVYHNDGPWKHGDNYWRGNGVLRYSQGDDARGFSVTALGYRGQWDATDQIARRAVDQGLIGRFGSLDTSSGGDSQRYSLSAEWHRRDQASATKLTAYAFYYDLDLFSNFTYLLDDPVNGDQFEQKDKRWVAGLAASHTWFHDWNGRFSETTIGLQSRNDIIENGLFKTADRQRLSTTRADDVLQNSVGIYLENKTQWLEKLRTIVGARGDVFHFHVSSDKPFNSGDVTDGLASPKLSLILGPWASTEVYLNGGLGFHSNDGRGATTRIDPGSGTSVNPVDPLVRTFGAELGVRTTWVPGLQSTLSFWWLDIDSELLFVGDAGTTEASRPSRRYGIEFANYYTPTKWLTFDADFSFSHAGFRDDDPAGDHIPGSIQTVFSTGISVHDLNGFFGELRLRYFGPRPLVEDNSVRSRASTLLNGRIGYQFNETWSLAFEVFNILDARVSDTDYFYTSRLPGEPAAGMKDVHFHPSEPRSFRAVVTARF